jgi:hypothetical protein
MAAAATLSGCNCGLFCCNRSECADSGCTGGSCNGGQCDDGCCGLGSCCSRLCGCWTGVCTGHSLAVPDVQPLGSVVRAHYHTMQTNGEAVDFILHRNDFIGNTAELTPAGKDHIMEIGARMRSAPFPVIVERSEHNADPELDAHRREIVARVLTDLGNADAYQRVFVSPAYGRALNSQEAEFDYYRFVYTRGGFGNFGNNFGGGWGGGFGGGVGFGGFGF